MLASVLLLVIGELFDLHLQLRVHHPVIVAAPDIMFAMRPCQGVPGYHTKLTTLDNSDSLRHNLDIL